MFSDYMPMNVSTILLCPSCRGSRMVLGQPIAAENGGQNGKKALANPWSRKKLTNNAYAGRGQESKWEIPARRG